MTNYIELAIKKALESGFDWKEAYGVPDNAEVNIGELKYLTAMPEKAFLSPDFWVALGKSLEWRNNGLCPICEAHYGKDFVPEAWHSEWLHFISHLADRKDPSLFFKNLLEQND